MKYMCCNRFLGGHILNRVLIEIRIEYISLGKNKVNVLDILKHIYFKKE